MIYTVRINNKDYEVEVERGKANIIKTVTVQENTAPAPIVAIPIAAVPEAAPASATAAASGNIVVHAPMPGTILDIKAAAGQPVKSGDLLLVLEAMKMENEILAPGNGTIKQVLVSKGASVSTDDILIIID